MSNMMLKIEADTGKLDAKLKQADDNVRKLEASVKIGGRTMRAAAQAPTNDQAGVSAVQAELVAELKRLNENLAKNSDATQANTSASKSSKPVGGSEGNMKEKY